jgi:hypothetical protein
MRAAAHHNELTLDIQMALALAPGALIYVVTAGGSSTGELTTLASIGAYQNSFSYYNNYNIQVTGENTLAEMALQGQSVLECSGDTGPFSVGNALNPRSTDLSEQAITLVGATYLHMDAGAYSSEAAWADTSGGPLAPFDGGAAMTIPPYQVDAVFGATNGASSSYRNVPDISMAGSNIEQVQGGHESGGAGTSFSSPAFAGFLALANQQATAGGSLPLARVGFANPALYQAAANDYSLYFHDVVSGYATTQCISSPCVPVTYYATAGYDLATGLGSPTCQLFSYLSSYNASPWTEVTGSSFTCVHAIAGVDSSSVAAWSLGCHANSNGDYSIYYLPAIGSNWVEAAGAASYIAVTPAGVPWVVTNGGIAYQLEYNGAPVSTWSSSDVWQEMNTAGQGGPHNYLSTIAPNSDGTAFATSKTLSGSDYTVYRYGGGASGNGTWALQSGVAFQQVSQGSANLLSRNHNGTSFIYEGGGSWTSINIATHEPYDPTYTGQAIWIAGGAYANYGWIVASNAWNDGSDKVILQLAQGTRLTQLGFLSMVGPLKCPSRRWEIHGS